MKLGKMMDDKALRRLDSRFDDDPYELLTSDSDGKKKKKKKFKDKLKELSGRELREKAIDYGIPESEVQLMDKKELRQRICEIHDAHKLGLDKGKTKDGKKSKGEPKNKIAAEIRASMRRTSPALAGTDDTPSVEVVYPKRKMSPEVDRALAPVRTVSAKRLDPPYYFDENTRKFVIANADTADDITVLRGMQSLGKIRQQIRPDDGFGEMMDRLTIQLMTNTLPPVPDATAAIEAPKEDVIDVECEVVETPAPPAGLIEDHTPDVIEVDAVEISDAEAMSAQLDSALNELNATAAEMKDVGRRYPFNSKDGKKRRK